MHTADYRAVGSLPVVMLAAALSCAGCTIDLAGQAVVVHEEKRFTVGPDANVSLQTFDGAIEVGSWDRNEVLVQIDRQGASSEEAQALEVRTTQEGNRVVIDARSPRGDGAVVRLGGQEPSVSLRVTVPRQLTLDARTGDGSIAAGDLSGAIRLQSGDGSIRADRVEGHITAHTGDGSISIHDARGTFDVDSGDGSIALGGRVDDLRVHSGDGSVSIDIADGSAMKGDWTVTTGDGSISVSVPSAFDADVQAQTGDGRIRADWAPSAPRFDEDDDSHSFRGQLGRGGRVLRLNSGDGSISINRR